MSYQVFARKYRPQTFDDVVGQEHVTRTLKNAVEQSRLAHAYLFVGPRGIGKTSTARILAKALNCIHGPTVNPCGVCDSCKEITAGNSLDVLEIDGASNNGVEQVRELRDNVRYAPAKSRFKIYIIDEVHMLTSQAFNALLKTLEEPPAHVKFIFATTEPQKVLATILSRCQRFDLHRIPAKLIAQHLDFIATKEKIKLAPAAGQTIARGAEGGLRDAESMLDQLVAFCGDEIAEADVLSVFGFTSTELIANLSEKILRAETAAALAVLDEQAAAGKEMMKLMSDLIAHLRDLLVVKVKPDALSDEATPETQSRLEAQAALIETDRLLELIEQFAATEGRMKWAPNKKLHFEVALIKAIQSLGQVTLTQVIENLAALREGGAAPSKPAVKKTVEARIERSAEKKIASSPNEDKSPAPNENKTAPTVDPAAIWSRAVELTYARRPLIKTWIDVPQPLGVEGNHFLLGFPANQKMVMEGLARPNNRTFLEGLLREITGQDWKIKLNVVEGMTATSESPPNESNRSYESDPLIKEALELFQGEIKSVTTT